MAFLGVIGGLGPMATAYYYELVTAMTDVPVDQQHIRMAIFSAPDIPDRTEYILGKSGRSPLPGIIEAGKALVSIGADVIAIPCVTAHYFHSEIEGTLGVRTLHAIRECAEILKAAGIERAGIAATEGTIQSGIFQSVLSEYGISSCAPGTSGQGKVNSLIYDFVKRGITPDIDLFFEVKDELMNNGAQAVILGCTELSILKRDFDTGSNVLDVTEVLARASVLACGKPLRKEFERLI
jgi:aspartate racemase